MLGLKPRQRVPAGTTVEMWLGISTDEAIRMKDSRDRWAARYDRPPGTLGLCYLPLPVPCKVGGDQAQVA